MDFIEEQQDQACRRFRERASADICPICYDERPNIITVCCGQGVCITCMARWLSENESCHSCRAQMSFRPTPSPLTKLVYVSPSRQLNGRRISRSLATPAYRRIIGNNHNRTNVPDSSNVPDSISIVRPIRRMPLSSSNNEINILSSTCPAVSTCFSPFEKYLRRILGNFRNESCFVSPQESTTLISTTAVNPTSTPIYSEIQNPLVSTEESSTYYGFPQDEDFCTSVIINAPVVAANLTTPLPTAIPTSTPFDNLSSITAIAMEYEEQRRPIYRKHRNHRKINQNFVANIPHPDCFYGDYSSEDSSINNSRHHSGRDIAAHPSGLKRPSQLTRQSQLVINRSSRPRRRCAHRRRSSVLHRVMT